MIGLLVLAYSAVAATAYTLAARHAPLIEETSEHFPALPSQAEIIELFPAQESQRKAA